MKTLNITYVPETKTIQAVVEFPYKGATQCAVVMTDSLSSPDLPTDFTAIEENETFKALATEAIQKKIDLIENPITI